MCIRDRTYSERYTYNAANGSMATALMGTGRTITFTYDKLQRLTKENLNGIYNRSYQLKDLSCLLYTSSKAADFVSGAVSTGVGQSLEKLTIRDYDKSWAEIGRNTLVEGATSLALGNSKGIKGVTAGRNSWSAVYKSGLTKLKRRTASRMSAKVMVKSLGANIVSGR